MEKVHGPTAYAVHLFSVLDFGIRVRETPHPVNQNRQRQAVMGTQGNGGPLHDCRGTDPVPPHAKHTLRRGLRSVVPPGLCHWWVTRRRVLSSPGTALESASEPPVSPGEPPPYRDPATTKTLAGLHNHLMLYVAWQNGHEIAGRLPGIKRS